MRVGVGVGVRVGLGVGERVGLGVPGGGVMTEVEVGVGVASKLGVIVGSAVSNGVGESNNVGEGVGVGGPIVGVGVSWTKAGSEGPGVMLSPMSPPGLFGCGGVDK